jgi:predicted component of type VI protein secretion system
MPPLRLVPPMGAPIEIANDRTLIGRDPTADIVVNDPSVSRRHAIIERRPEGWAIFDQRSANGTWLENQRVEQALLVSRQQLRLGAVTFEVLIEGAAPGPQPAPAARPAPAYVAPPAPVQARAPAAPAYVPPAPAPPAHPTYPPQASPPGLASPPAPAIARTPSYVPPPAAPAGLVRPAAPAAAGGMTEAEAAEILGLWPGSPAEEVRRRYQKLYNDFQVRLTNAPTPSLKKMYQKSIQDLRTACDVLCPGALA